MTAILHFVFKHGYSLLFGALFAHQIGLPLPGPLFLLAAGALAASGKLSFTGSVCLAIAACVLADWPWYEAGRRSGDKVLHFIHRFTRDPDAHDRRAKETFTRFGPPILLISKFVPGLDAVTPPLAGTSRTSRARFLAFDAIGAGLYACTYASIGYIFDHDLDRAAAYVSRAGTLLAGMIVIALFLVVVRKLVLAHVRGARLVRVKPAEPEASESVVSMNASEFFAKYGTTEGAIAGGDTRGSGRHVEPVLHVEAVKDKEQWDHVTHSVAPYMTKGGRAGDAAVLCNLAMQRDMRYPGEATTLIAKDAHGEFAGLTQFYEADRALQVDFLAVNPAILDGRMPFRGTGTHMMTEVAREASRKGLAITLESLDQESDRFYRALGMKQQPGESRLATFSWDRDDVDRFARFARSASDDRAEVRLLQTAALLAEGQHAPLAAPGRRKSIKSADQAKYGTSDQPALTFKDKNGKYVLRRAPAARKGVNHDD
jgi:membrane protein DedA with SNARE-associated domain